VIIGHVDEIKESLAHFFDFVNGKKAYIKPFGVSYEDEIGEMTVMINENMKVAREQVELEHELIANIKVAVDNVKEGDLSTRIEVVGDSRLLIQTKDMLNSMLSLFEHTFDDINEVMGHLSKGNFNEKITNKYSGDFDVTKQAINNVSNKLQSMVSNFEITRDAIKVGDLKTRVDYKGFEGGYDTIITTANNILRDVDDVFIEIAKGLKSLGDGKFDSRITKEYSGDFNTVSLSVNQLATTLQTVILDISNIMKTGAYFNKVYFIGI
jgi:methyl-accepting chemotaxis protein